MNHHIEGATWVKVVKELPLGLLYWLANVTKEAKLWCHVGEEEK